nr:hypothetical protein [Salmonella enterica]WDM56542.1 hypothetical protein K0024_00625 [Salmonella enterica subsp. enterica serovar Heidelberg]
MSEKPACGDRSGRAACRAGNGAPAHLTVCKATAPDGAVNPSAATLRPVSLDFPGLE